MTPRAALKLQDSPGTAREEAGELLEGAYRQVLSALGMLGYPVTTDGNFTETAARAARAMLEMVHPVDEIEDELREMLGCTFAARFAAPGARLL
ncbi:MAG: hypothetical protein H0T79_08445 [Deltaproteobacteria bacterium]|nr:hypothetical protein [Deltaproteobacteria bacterium]